MAGNKNTVPVTTMEYLQAVVMTLNELTNKEDQEFFYMNLIYKFRANIAYHLKSQVGYDDKKKKYVIQELSDVCYLNTLKF